MSYPDLPPTVKAMLSDEQMRTHHHLWHFVRNRSSWESLPPTSRSALEAQGWSTPRFEDDEGSGIDFLGMHRQMIRMTDVALASAGDPSWPRVTGWDPIPWDDEDSQWPVPSWQDEPPSWASQDQWDRFSELAYHARSEERIRQMRQIAEALMSPQELRRMSLDQLGSSMEWSIHGWMHIRWSGTPHQEGFSSDVSNDWLFVPWSSHVNRHFWKLHGWIDERVADWERATGQVADLSGAWAGASNHLGGMHHSASTSLLEFLPNREDVPLPMQVKEHIVEGLLRK